MNRLMLGYIRLICHAVILSTSIRIGEMPISDAQEDALEYISKLARISEKLDEKANKICGW